MPVSEDDTEGGTVWPPPPTLQAPPVPKRLGWFRPMADVPFWVLPLVAAVYILLFTGSYWLGRCLEHKPFIWLDALIQGVVPGFVLLCIFLWVRYEARKRRRDNPAQ